MGAAAPATRNRAPSVRQSRRSPSRVPVGGREPAPTREADGKSCLDDCFGCDEVDETGGRSFEVAVLFGEGKLDVEAAEEGEEVEREGCATDGGGWGEVAHVVVVSV